MRTRPSEPPVWSLTELAAELDTTATGDATVTGIALHSSHVRAGDLYVALPGASAHGAAFTAAAKARGAAAVLTDVEGSALVTGLPSMIVEEPRRRVAALSSFIYDHPSSAF